MDKMPNMMIAVRGRAIPTDADVISVLLRPELVSAAKRYLFTHPSSCNSTIFAREYSARTYTDIAGKYRISVRDLRLAVRVLTYVQSKRDAASEPHPS